MTRSPQEVFAHHGRALASGDLDEIVLDYADESVLISAAGVERGGDGARTFFANFRDGIVVAQTVRYTVQPQG